MISNFTSLLAGAVVIVFCMGAHAQVCREPNAIVSNGASNIKCDMRYRSAVITCDTKNPGDIVGTRPACPKKPMPMIDTPLKSYITDYSPYLFTYPRDATDNSRPYAGNYSLGTPGDSVSTFQLFGNTPANTKRLAACTTQIRVPLNPTTPEEDAKLTRLQLDNCTNQYIINEALYPFQKENVKLLSLDDPSDPTKRLNLEGECQPLQTSRVTVNEYLPSDYLKLAWNKTMFNPLARKWFNVFAGVPCTPATVGTVPCDREPHLPYGTTISNPLKVPDPFPEVTLSTLAAVKYEEIVDPTHPFSPRWDFLINDREYANPDAAWYNFYSLPLVWINYNMANLYMSKIKDTVFCAGVKNADKVLDAQKKKEMTVPVDVMEWRRPAFEDGLIRRSLYNAVCYMHKQNPKILLDAAGFANIKYSYCYTVVPIYTGASFHLLFTFKDCWACFGLSGKVDDESKHPPCTSNYLGTDLTMKGVLPGGFNLYSRQAQCNIPLVKRDGKYDMDKLCRDIRKPYTQINRLKMRYHNPGDKNDTAGNNIVLTKGVQEGFTFKEYFDNHMPYPKIWDLGTALRQSGSSYDINDQPPLDTMGQYTAIVGIGREAAAKSSAASIPPDANGDTADKAFTDQRCLSGGWGTQAQAPTAGTGTTPLSAGTGWGSAASQAAALPALVSFGGTAIAVPDPITSWTETKLYQTRTLRNLGLSCIARYDKVFKSGSAENLLLMTAGADWSKLTIARCQRGAGGQTSNCTYPTLQQYVDAGSPSPDNSTIYMKQLDPQAFPNGWRGYMAAADPAVKFPNFGRTAPTITGLNNAQLGDIILLPYGPKNTAVKPGLAKLAMVIETKLKDCDDNKSCYVRVLEPDDGKWPDSCGTTDTWGQAKSRYYFKPGNLPTAAQDEFTKIQSTADCEETRLSQCEQSAWDTLKIYRMADDERDGCKSQTKAINCAKE